MPGPDNTTGSRDFLSDSRTLAISAVVAIVAVVVGAVAAYLALR